MTGSVEAIRDAMIAEIETGADGTDVRCGVIKVGTAREPNEPAERLLRAAAAAARATGAPIITHTSSPDQAAWHIRVLESAGMDMTHVVISHMGAAKDVSDLVEVARAGVFMGIDKVSFPKGPDQRRACRSRARRLRQGARAAAHPLVGYRAPHACSRAIGGRGYCHGVARFRADAVTSAAFRRRRSRRCCATIRPGC